MQQYRQQLTLFASASEAAVIEQIRKKYNPVQYGLIPAHVTLCRDEELNDTARLIQQIMQSSISVLQLKFGSAELFESGKGVWLPGIDPSGNFNFLRMQLLKDLIPNVGQHRPHITLMHPRNSNCTKEIYDEIKQIPLPQKLNFNRISLIEQRNGGKWTILREFDLMPI